MRRLALARRIERQRKIVARLLVVRDRRRAGLRGSAVAAVVLGCPPRFAQLEFGLDRADRLVGRAVGPHELQRRAWRARDRRS